MFIKSKFTITVVFLLLITFVLWVLLCFALITSVVRRGNSVSNQFWLVWGFITVYIFVICLLIIHACRTGDIELLVKFVAIMTIFKFFLWLLSKIPYMLDQNNENIYYTFLLFVKYFQWEKLFIWLYFCVICAYCTTWFSVKPVLLFLSYCIYQISIILIVSLLWKFLCPSSTYIQNKKSFYYDYQNFFVSQVYNNSVIININKMIDAFWFDFILQLLRNEKNIIIVYFYRVVIIILRIMITMVLICLILTFVLFLFTTIGYDVSLFYVEKLGYQDYNLEIQLQKMIWNKYFL